MDKDKLQSLANSRTALIDKIISNLSNQVTGNQDQLLRRVLDDFISKLQTKNGILLNNLKNKQLLQQLEGLFSDFKSTKGLDTAKIIVESVQKIINFNQSYFEVFSSPAQLIPVKMETAQLISGWLGIDKNGKVAPNGYIDTLISNDSVKNDVRNIVVKDIITQTGFFEAKNNLKNYIVGNKEQTGALQKYYRNFVYDAFSQFDRANAKLYADNLNLDYAIYEGGLIETSRKWCIEHNGKVYSREEIAEFNPKVAIPPDYNPFTDLGGYGCRHHLNWIPKVLAFALRPELKTAA
jgi:hypothetical protein